MILIWLPGGVAQTDTWDPKKHTPFTAGMKGNELLGTCPIVPTSADGILFGEGSETIGSVMNKGTVLRSLTNETKFGAVHLKAQYYMKTGYLFPAGVKAPSIGSIVARSLGRKHPNVPAYHRHRPRHQLRRPGIPLHQRVLRPRLLRTEVRAVHDPRAGAGNGDAQRRRRHEDRPPRPPPGVSRDRSPA